MPPVLSTTPHSLALIEPTMTAKATMVPTAEISAPSRPALAACPTVPPARAVMKPAPPVSPRKTGKASRTSGEGGVQPSPGVVALPTQVRRSVTTADALPRVTPFLDQPFLKDLPRPGPFPIDPPRYSP